jgi:hypothetical protein
MTVQKMLLAALAAVAIRLGLVFEEYGQQPERTGRKRSKEIASNRLRFLYNKIQTARPPD